MTETKSIAKIDTWLKNIENGNFKSKTVRVLNFIQNNPNTTVRDMRAALDIPHQTITSVLSNIMDEGAIKMNDMIEIEDISYSCLEFVSDPEKRADLKYNRQREKFIGWAKQGIEQYKDLLTPFTRRELIAIMEPKNDLFNQTS